MLLRPVFGQKLALILAMLCLVAGIFGDSSALAATKKKKGDDGAAKAEAEMQKNLEPITEQLGKLMVKIQSRSLLSPNEAGQLVDIKYKLMDMMDQHPQNALLAKPIYQAGILFSERESFNDAYELFNYVAQGFPATQYGAKAKSQIQQLEKRFGNSYFSVEAATPPSAASATGATPAPDKPTRKQ